VVREPLQRMGARSGTSWLEEVADPIRLGILRSLSQVTEATTADLATWGQASSQTLRRHLEALVSVGVIREHPAISDGETPGRPAARFSLSKEVRESVRAVFGFSNFRSGAGAPIVQAVGAPPSRSTFASTRSIAAAGPMNGAKAR
jgi:DNA-binding transcriptional ArsR family regulator